MEKQASQVKISKYVPNIYLDSFLFLYLIPSSIVCLTIAWEDVGEEYANVAPARQPGLIKFSKV